MPHLGVLRGDTSRICGECRGKGLGKCRHMELGKRRTVTCNCFFVVCHCDECPAGEGQIDRYCSPRYCKFFEGK